MIQDLINASTGICQLGAQTYTLSSAATINRPLIMRGQGDATKIVVPSTQDGIVIATTGPVVLQDFTVTATAPKTGGYGIKFNSTGLNVNSRLSNLQIQNQYIGIGMLNAYFWMIRETDVEGSVLIGIEVANPLLPDAGDSLITGCTFLSTYPANAILQRSGGGLKLIGNKILSHANGYGMAMDGMTSVLVITGNSIEGQSACPIILTQAAGGVFSLVTITGNEFGVSSGGIGISVAGSSWCDRIVVTGNVGSLRTGATFTSMNVPNQVIANNLVL